MSQKWRIRHHVVPTHSTLLLVTIDQSLQAISSFGVAVGARLKMLEMRHILGPMFAQ